jgi:hypothetical protein
MKYLKAYIIIAMLALSVASSQQALAKTKKPPPGTPIVIPAIDVEVRKDPGSPRSSTSRQTASPDGHGGYTVYLPGAGVYTISYANGPKTGQVIKKVTVPKTGGVKRIHCHILAHED